MKYWMYALCACVYCFTFSYADDETIEPLVEEHNDTEEVATLDPNFLSQPSALPQNFEMPSPTLPLPERKKSAFLAVSLSSLLPGLGHTYLGDFKTAGSLLGSSGAGFGTGVLGAVNHDETIQFSGLIAMNSTWLYGIYAAYRDVRVYNNQAGYLHKMPMDNFSDLSLAPFSLSILKKPEVWGGILGALSIGIVVSYFAYRDMPSHIDCNFSSKRIKPIIALPIAIGEEAFFRGYLQSAFLETLSPWGAITLSSLVFGAAHIPNAQVLDPEYRWRYYSFSLPVITAFGSYFGWLTYKNQSLKESVALHTWYDFTLFLISSSAAQSAIATEPRFAFSLSF